MKSETEKRIARNQLEAIKQACLRIKNARAMWESTVNGMDIDKAECGVRTAIKRFACSFQHSTPNNKRLHTIVAEFNNQTIGMTLAQLERIEIKL